MTDGAENDIVTKQEARIHALETGLKQLTTKLTNPTISMMLAGALAHNEHLRPMRNIITAHEAKKIFLAMISALNKPDIDTQKEGPF